MLLDADKSSIDLLIDGTSFTGWESFSATFDMESLVSSFRLDLHDSGNVLADVASSDLKTGAACRISISNPLVSIPTPVIDGFLTNTSRSIDTASTALMVEGADKLVDLLDCSAMHTSRTWSRKTFSSIIYDLLSPFGLFVNPNALGADDPLIEKFTLQSGEAVFDAVERLCRSQAVLPLSSFSGDLILGYAATGNERALEDLSLPGNLLSLTESVDWTERFSEYTAIGQGPGDGKRWTKEMLQAAATATDTGVTRYRPKLIMSENKVTKEILVKRVGWEAQVRSGRSTEFTGVVRGWYQRTPSGIPAALWEKNKRVGLRCPEWRVDVDRLITKVVFSLDATGELTTLTLKHPGVFAADPGQRVDLT
jgi:prophage tail gpP-like protein